MKEESYGIIPYRLNRDGVSILLYKTSKNSTYNFFKGKRELSETIIKTALRETKFSWFYFSHIFQARNPFPKACEEYFPEQNIHAFQKAK